MKRAVVGIAAVSGSLVIAMLTALVLDSPGARRTSAAITHSTVNDMSATAKVGATKETTQWTSSTNPLPASSTEMANARQTTGITRSRTSIAKAAAVQSVAPAFAASVPAKTTTTDPYRYSMTDPNAGPVIVADAATISTIAAKESVPPNRLQQTAIATIGVAWSPDPDTATADSWWASIRANYPQTGMHYAWIEHAGFHVADWKLNGAGMRPVDYFGSLGLDSPLGTCHGIVEFTPIGLLKSTARGLVCVFGKFCVAATVDMPRCPQGVCSAHYDRPCVLLEPDDYPVWVGGNPDDPKEREMWGMKP